MELHLTLRQPCTGTQAMQTTELEGVERLGFLFIFCVPNHRGLTPDALRAGPQLAGPPEHCAVLVMSGGGVSMW